MSPTRKNGKICYLEMPAGDVARSADFYDRLETVSETSAHASEVDTARSPI